MPDIAFHHPVMCERSPPTLAQFNWMMTPFNRAMHTWRVETAPADLTGLSDTDLKSLDYACDQVWWDASWARRDEIEPLHRKIIAERDRRGLNDTFKREAA